MASPFGFERNPQLVWDFYNARRANVRTVRPNPGHHALVALEARFGNRFALVTQNVDGLHRDAGSRNVFEIHGSLRRTRCTGCGETTDRGLDPLPALPHCACGALLRPDIVWFHENLPVDIWEGAQIAAAECEVLLVVGTSAVVYPAAGLIHHARAAGAFTIEINPEATDVSAQVDCAIALGAEYALPELEARS